MPERRLRTLGLPSGRRDPEIGRDRRPALRHTLRVRRRALVLGSLSLPLAACAARLAGPAPAEGRFAALRGACAGVPAIGAGERAQRRERARGWLRDHGLSALLVEAGENLVYLAGIGWGRSERPLLYLLPAAGPPALVAPAFEERTLLERAAEAGSEEVRLALWQEHESPHARLAEAARAAGVAGPVALDPWTRHFVAEGARAAGLTLAPGDALLRALRGRKSAAELALLRRANEATKAALRAASGYVSEGMSQEDLAGLVRAALAEAGLADPWALVLFGEAAALPHGTRAPRHLRRGDLILVDTGGALHGYQSDITRTWPFGPVSAAQARAWAAVSRAQTAALAELRPGRPCEAADAAARAAIAAAGLGEGYARFTHRLGHGIGLQTHEDPYLVRGNAAALAPGMTMSNEPGVYVPGELGVRLEDIVAITEGEPEVFGPRAAAIDAPFG